MDGDLFYVTDDAFVCLMPLFEAELPLILARAICLYLPAGSSALNALPKPRLENDRSMRSHSGLNLLSWVIDVTITARRSSVSGPYFSPILFS